MAPGVVADLAAGGDHLLQQVDMMPDLAADDKEGGHRVVLGEQAEDFAVVGGGGAVVEGEGDDVLAGLVQGALGQGQRTAGIEVRGVEGGVTVAGDIAAVAGQRRPGARQHSPRTHQQSAGQPGEIATVDFHASASAPKILPFKVWPMKSSDRLPNSRSTRSVNPARW